MKNIKLLLLLSLAGFVCSCGDRRTGGELTEPYRISFDISRIDKNTPFPAMSEIIDKLEYVKLETVEGYLIGSVYEKPAITDKHIVLFDRSAGLLQYTREGKFVRRIGSIGRGPGELPEFGPRGIYIDEEKGILHCIVHWSSYEVMRYDLGTGKFIEKVTITDSDGSPLPQGTLMNSFLPLSDGLFLISTGDSFMVSMYASDVCLFMTLDIVSGQITHKVPSSVYNENNVSAYAVFLPQPAWCDPEGRITVYENGADTMYVVNKDFSLSPRIVADFGGKEFEIPAVMDEASGMAIRSAMESGDYIVFDLAEGMPFARGTEPMKYYRMSFDKTTGERSLAGYDFENHFWAGPVNDIDGGFSFLQPYDGDMWWWSYDAYKMIENLTPEHFEKVRRSVKHPERLEKLEALAATLSEDDNPVIVIAHTKK